MVAKRKAGPGKRGAFPGNDGVHSDRILLRRRAEDFIRDNNGWSSENLEAQAPEEIRRTLHELRVHKIELKLQNEELRRNQIELDAARDRYFDLFDLAPVGYCTVEDNRTRPWSSLPFRTTAWAWIMVRRPKFSPWTKTRRESAPMANPVPALG